MQPYTKGIFLGSFATIELLKHIAKQLDFRFAATVLTTMTELTQSNPIEQATPEELAAAIAELQEYRDRLVEETMTAAKKAKVMKTQAQGSLEPALAKIDAMLSELRERQAALTNGN